MERTISFAISGAVVAIKAKFDLFGVAFVGVITAMGGGIVRDILIGRYPPAVFTNFYIFLITVISLLIGIDGLKIQKTKQQLI